MKNQLVRLLLLMLTLGWAGCTVNESMGPRGLEGPPGNANVFSLNFDFLMADAVLNGTVASVQYDVPDLGVSVVDDGAVLMFFRDQGTWTAMPYTFGVESSEVPAVDYTVSFGFGYEVGFLEVFYEVSIDVIDVAPLSDREIKLVVIDGFFYGKQSIDLTDWETVKAIYDLED